MKIYKTSSADKGRYDGAGTRRHRRNKDSSDSFFYKFLRGSYIAVGITLFVVFALEYFVFSSAFNVKKISIRNITGTAQVPKSENILVVGVDNRGDIPRNVRGQLHVGSEGCNCTDTMMLVHLSYENKTIRILNIPRDTYVYYPTYNLSYAERLNLKNRHIVESKINAAYTYGGRELTIDIVRDILKVNIDHYVELNFLSIVNIVDAIGGVDVYSNTPVIDRKSGLHLVRGMNHLDGVAALKYSRARYFDGQGDIGRMNRQQLLISAMMKKILEKFNNPIEINRLVKLISNFIYTDDKMTDSKIVERISTMIPLNNNLVGLDSMILPIESLSHKMRDGGDSVLLNTQYVAALSYLIDRDINFTHEDYFNVYNQARASTVEQNTSSSD